MPSLVFGNNPLQPQRRFPRYIIGDFTFTSQHHQFRSTLFLARNLRRSLDSHQRRREGQIKIGDAQQSQSTELRIQEPSSAENNSTGAVAEESSRAVGQSVGNFAVSGQTHIHLRSEPGSSNIQNVVSRVAGVSDVVIIVSASDGTDAKK